MSTWIPSKTSSQHRVPAGRVMLPRGSSALLLAWGQLAAPAELHICEKGRMSMTWERNSLSGAERFVRKRWVL